MILSWQTLSATSGLTIQNCRTSMKKLEDSGVVKRLSTSKYQVVTLLKWDKLQGKEDEVNNQTNKQLTSYQQATNKQLTTTKEDKNNKKDKNTPSNDGVGWKNLAAESIFPIKKLVEVYLSDEELKKVVSGNNNNNFENIEHLEKRLLEFEKHLSGMAQVIKSPKDFGSHFLRWHKKNKKENSKTKPHRNR